MKKILLTEQLTDPAVLQPGGMQFQSLQDSFPPSRINSQLATFWNTVFNTASTILPTQVLLHAQFKCREHHQIFPVHPSSGTADQIHQLQLQFFSVPDVRPKSSRINCCHCHSPWNLHAVVWEVILKMSYVNTQKRNVLADRSPTRQWTVWCKIPA